MNRPPQWRGFSRTPEVARAGDSLIRTLGIMVYDDAIRGFRVLVPAGLYCDGASIPRPALRLLGIPRQASRARAPGLDGLAGMTTAQLERWLTVLRDGILHDYLSRVDASIIVAGDVSPVPSKAWAARVMAEGLLARGAVSPAAALAIRSVLVLAPGYWHRRAVGWQG